MKQNLPIFRKNFGASSKRALLAATLSLVAGCAHGTNTQAERGIAKDRTESEPRKIVEKLKKPSATGCYSLAYRGFQQTLRPGEGMEFEVPSDLHKKPLTFVVLGHAQMQGYGDNDGSPGLTSLQFRSSDDGRWKYWGGPSSGDAGAKFAEYRWGGLELEGLYEWGHYGHYDLENRTRDTSALHIDRIRAVSTGSDPVVVGEVSVTFWPDEAKSTQEFLFTRSTRFGEYASSEGASYPLDYSSAWELGYSSGTKSDPAGATLSNGRITISLETGQKLASIEVACGDAPRNGSNPGSASIDVRVVHADGSSEAWKSNENVPPAGIVKAASPACDFTAKKGDRVEISGSGQMWVMGVRLGFL